MTPSAHDTGVVELFAALAYAELTAFSRLASDSDTAPTLTARIELAGLAARELQHHQMLADRIHELGAEPRAAMAPFVAAVDQFHVRTSPHTWAERLVKTAVIDGLAGDLLAQLAARLDDTDHVLLEKVLDRSRSDGVVAPLLAEALTAEPMAAGRLALWGRRVLGEAMSQGQRTGVDHPHLVATVVGSDDVAGLSAFLGRLADGHAERLVAARP
ncbi:ferritin-like fold-containing protein [Arsenicicoccus dermatophilus]|uniref:ferritin-like fold-containing protein n=1 Tax=Arsenicicoccus dermatophilus TaxID=1076331 RepID=UPI001F4CDD19|nr:ferritin-like fold-containing protein [Arsenicicoccus dermatophilus]MCH8613650.1 ferritin-like domain-containing protein [Arsenicicoccus dermatophilus]